MKKAVILSGLILCLTTLAPAQPELYSDYFIGLPEFRILPLRLPTANPDSVRVEIHLRIVYDDLQFVKKGDHYEAGYGVDVTLRDEDDHTCGLEHIEREVNTDSYAKTNSRQLGDQTSVAFVVAPIQYKLKVALTDRESRKTREINDAIKFAKKDWSPELRLGDIYLVDSTGTAVMTTGIMKGQRIAAVYQLFSNKSQEVSASFALFTESGRSLAQGALPWKGDETFMRDTLYLASDTLSNQTYPLILSAKLGNITQARSYPIKILWQNLPVYIQDLDLAIRQLHYIAKPEEIERMRNAPPEKRSELFKEFWANKNPNPSSSSNERMEEYYRRIEYSNEHFSRHGTGWETDMGQVYVIYGAPSDVERHPFDTNTKPYEIWYYYDLNRKFLFMDEEGFGVYRLKSPFWDDF